MKKLRLEAGAQYREGNDVDLNVSGHARLPSQNFTTVTSQNRAKRKKESHVWERKSLSAS